MINTAENPVIDSTVKCTMNGVLSYEASKMHLYSVDEFAEDFAKGLGKAYDMNDIRQQVSR